MRLPEATPRHDTQATAPTGSGHRQVPLGRPDRAVMLGHPPELTGALRAFAHRALDLFRRRDLSHVPQVSHRLGPELAPEGVVDEPVAVLGQHVRIEMLDRVDDLRVPRAPSLV